jgi:hypothetical protein
MTEAEQDQGVPVREISRGELLKTAGATAFLGLIPHQVRAQTMDRTGRTRYTNHGYLYDETSAHWQ